MTAEEFLQDSLEISHFYNDEYEKMCCFSDEIQKIMDNYARHVLKIAAQKAKIKRNYYPDNEALDSQIEKRDFHDGDYNYFISLESIINCLK